MTTSKSDAIVFFGASGDLAYKQIFPALESMVRRGNLNMPVIGVAKSGWTLDDLKKRVKDSLAHYYSGSDGADPDAENKLCSLLQYIDGDYKDGKTFEQLQKALKDSKRPLYYLAIPPNLFATVAEALSKFENITEARVVVEKPFGRDLASAEKLNGILRKYFKQENIFRIDHYLGKEPVQNLLYFRFANSSVHAAWNNKHIESVQITMAETIGVDDRGKLYDELGAIRDVVQNHMLEVIACLAMECPPGSDHQVVCNERGRLIKQIRTLETDDVVRGQFKGYKNEKGVASDSATETFAALRFHIDNERWSGVPFYVRAGKCLPVSSTEVMVRLKRPAHLVLDEEAQSGDSYYRFRLSPEVIVALGARVKKPGELMVGDPTELVAHYQPPDVMQPYERLLGDAADGDSTMFAREEFVEAAWRIVDPALGNATPLYAYEPGSWGPPELESIIRRPGAGTTRKQLRKTDRFGALHKLLLVLTSPGVVSLSRQVRL